MAKAGMVHHWKHGWIPLDAYARGVVAKKEQDKAARLKVSSGGKMFDALNKDGGFTFDPKKHALIKVGSMDGVVVARPGTEKIVGTTGVHREAFANAVADVIEHHQADFDKGAKLGGWYSPDRGVYMVELTDIFPDRASAVKAGKDRNQEGVFDLKTGDFIPTGGTGDHHPDPAPGDPFTQGAKYDTPVEDIPGMKFNQAAADDPVVKELKKDPKVWEENVPTYEYQLEGTTVQATEKYLRSKPINKVVSGAEPFRDGYDPYILKTDHGDVVIDGHHRFAMYAAMGRQSAPVKVLDVRGGRSAADAIKEARVIKDAADEAAAKAKAAEPQVTPLLLSVAKNSGGRMDQLDKRFKALPSLARKIRDKAMEKGITPDQYAEKSLSDSLRFTMLTKPENYTSAIKKSLADFEARGYKIEVVKNTWPVIGTDYKGVNVSVRHPNGTLFELQFHTEESLASKNAQHKDFELARDLSVTPKIREAAKARMVLNASRLTMPRGISTLASIGL